MAKTIKINGVTYNDVKYMQAPLASDETKMAIFHDTTDADAKASSVKDGEWFYAEGEKREGKMPVNSAVSGKIATKNGTVTVPEGYTPGGTVELDSSATADLIPTNIRKDVIILGVTGTMDSTEGMNPQEKTITPSKETQYAVPTDGHNCLSKVTVNPIPAQYIVTTIDANAATEEDIKNGQKAFVNGKLVTGKHTDPAFSLANGVLVIR